MPKQKLHSKHFYKYFICPHWIWYDVYEDKEKHKHVPPLLNVLYEGKLRDEKGVLKNWEFSEIDRDQYKDAEEAFLVTLELMKQGKNIYRGVLMHEDWVGEPDFLEARPVSELGLKSSNFGDYYYVVYDIRADPELKNEFKLPLVFCSLILEKLQGVLSQDAYFIDPHGNTISFLIEPYLEEFQLTRNSIVKILEGEKPYPFLKSGCKKTPWYSVCEADAKGCNDISLIHRISPADQRRFYDTGIKTVTQLAEADIDALRGEFPEWYYDKLVFFQGQAQVLRSGETRIVKKPSFPKVRNEIYFDVESDPTQGVVYLLGFLTHDTKTNKKSYMYFMARTKEEEEEIWKKFLSFLDGLDDFVIYYYGYYENHVISTLFRKYGGDSALVRKFRDNSLDVLKFVFDSVIFPLYFYSLKDVARFIGFSWQAEDAGGAESVLWYDEWLRTKKDSLLKKILAYNEDDVRATLFVKQWLEKQKPRKERERRVLPE